MEERSRRRIRDLVARPASLGLSENEIGCARISMMARNTNVPFKGRIQKRETYHLQIITFRLQRAAGPYSRATSGLMRCSKQDRYSMTSSAMASSHAATFSPTILAAWALMTSSSFNTRITGKSAGRLRLSCKSWPAHKQNCGDIIVRFLPFLHGHMGGIIMKTITLAVTTMLLLAAITMTATPQSQ